MTSYVEKDCANKAAGPKEGTGVQARFHVHFGWPLTSGIQMQKSCDVGDAFPDSPGMLSDSHNQFSPAHEPWRWTGENCASWFWRFSWLYNKIRLNDFIKHPPCLVKDGSFYNLSILTITGLNYVWSWLVMIPLFGNRSYFDSVIFVSS